MATLTFSDLRFSMEKENISVTFLTLFSFTIEKENVERIGSFSVNEGSITFDGVSEQRATHKFNQLLYEGFQQLKNKMNGKPTVYVHKHSGIPLIGHIAFGIIDRDTSIIEVKPITSCNIECTYCSVDEDKRPIDFVVEKDYLVEELRTVVALKKSDTVEINIGTQGEPFLYAPLVDLIADISKIPKIQTISVNTNGTFLTEHLIEKLADAGLTRINLSVNAMDDQKAREIAASPRYNIQYIKKIIPLIQKKLDLLIAPVWIPGVNDDEIPKIIEFCQSLDPKPRVMIQNFLNYKYGRNPVKAASWDEFEDKLHQWENKFHIQLRYDMNEAFHVQKDMVLPNPLKKGDVIKAEIIGPGRLHGESIGVSHNRAISVRGLIPKGQMKVRVTKVKDHLCYAEAL